MVTAISATTKRANVALVVPESAVFRFSFVKNDFQSDGASHPMPTLRAYITHDLLRASGILDPSRGLIDVVYASAESVKTDSMCLKQNSLVDSLMRSSGGPTDHHSLDLLKAGAGDDNPIGPGVYDYSRAIVVASVAAAECLLAGYKCAINWSGGMHHACFNKMLGFCYLNDITAAIEVLLKKFSRVLYIDIDIHHGDGVENDWREDERITTLSVHYYDGNYFPGTGLEPVVINDTGSVQINLPMAGNLCDQRFTYLMKEVIDIVVKSKQPDVIVLQSGADSLAGDPLGLSNLSGIGHASVLAHVKRLNLPVLLLGGGGYNIVNVPRTWALETAIAADVRLPHWEQVLPKMSPCIRTVMEGVDEWVVPDFNVVDSNTSKSIERLRCFVVDKLEQAYGREK